MTAVERRADEILVPYGDTTGDAAAQVSFTLPLDAGPRATEAARVLVRKMGFREVEVVETKSVGKGFALCIVYGRDLTHHVAADEIVLREASLEPYEFKEANAIIREELGRKLVVVGACIGTDTHTVGIDAILNVKGYKRHPGLEAYPEVKAHNLGSQVDPEKLLLQAMEVEADAVLVSQVVTQKDLHVKTLTRFIELAEGFGVRDRMVLVAGGPHITHKLAIELGFDAGLGRGTYAQHALSFILRKLRERRRAGGSPS